MIPGGRVEQGETWKHSAMRECLEEAGVVLDSASIKSIRFYNGYVSRPLKKQRRNTL